MNDNENQMLREALTTVNKLVVANDLAVDCRIDTKNEVPYVQVGVAVEGQNGVAIQLPLERVQMDGNVTLLKPITLPDINGATANGLYDEED